MGQKVNPIGIRLGITRDWTSRWYAGKRQFPLQVHTDFRVREFLKQRLAEASVSRILIERAAKKVNITIQTARPGIVIGKKGEDIEKLRQETAALLGMPVNDVRLNIAEIRKPELDSQLVADSIAQQIEKRVMFRRAMKRAVMSTMRSGALGVKVRVSGRLNGSEIARTEWYREGRIPLHTFRADIDYGLSEANTTYGVIGVKVWIFKGEVFDKSELAQQAAEGEVAAAPSAHDRSRDRGGAPCHGALREARRTDLDPRVSGRPDQQEAARGPHGQRQGQRRVLRSPRAARQGVVRDGGCGRGDGPRGVPARRLEAVGVHLIRETAGSLDGSQGATHQIPGRARR